MNIRITTATVIFCLLLPLPGLLGNELPGREVWLPESEVKDRFFSYLIGLVQVDTCGVLDAGDLESILKDFKGQTSIPFELIKVIKRECADAGSLQHTGLSPGFGKHQLDGEILRMGDSL